MSKRWMMLTCILLVGSAGPSQAHPLDSPDIVYIDGLPCNSLCQSYMAWSRAASSKSAQSAIAQPAKRSTNATARRASRLSRESSKPAAPARPAKQAAPNPNTTPEAKTADLQPAGNAAAISDTARPNVAAPAKADAAANPKPRTIQAQVAAATAVAERVTIATAVPAPAQTASNTDPSNRSEPAVDAEKTATASPNNANLLVALLMARPDIKSVSDLAGKDIAIDDRQSASSDDVRTAIVAAGAAEVQLSEGQTMAIDRLIGGEVPAAVLTLVSPEAADAFPEIAGFKIFRIRLSPHS
jgi:hypothetical protein